MSTRWSKRERLIATARKLGVAFSSTDSDHTLENRINNSRATFDQLEYLREFLKPHKRKPPAGLTYKQAADLIAQIEDDLNTHAISALDLADGCVREWEGNYYLVLRVFGGMHSHKIKVQKVKLSLPMGATRAKLTPIGKEWVTSPHKLIGVSVPVDLSNWRPNLERASRSDDPPF